MYFFHLKGALDKTISDEPCRDHPNTQAGLTCCRVGLVTAVGQAQGSFVNLAQIYLVCVNLRCTDMLLKSDLDKLDLF